MKTIYKYLIGIGIFILCLLFSFVSGCNRGKKLCKQDIVTNTVILHDTVIHNIVDSFPYYIHGATQIVYETDTIYKNVDTIAVVRDYFSTHITDNIWQDSLVQVKIKTYISQNELKHSVFNYKILRPQQITYTNVDNSVNFTRYIYFGASLPIYPAKVNGISNINYIGLNGIYAFPKGYAEIMYQPYTKTFTIGTGLKIFKFK
jgi:hypothetical protein